MNTVIDILKDRGLFDDMTDPALATVVKEPTTVYAGFDPTSSSLQVGNFVTIMGLAHFQRCGHPVVALVGGATGMIGDPSGKSTERNLLSAEEVERNLVGIRENLSRFLDFTDTKAPARIVNNNDWMKQFTFVDFLRDVGKHFRMGTMLNKDSVRSRLDSETGMSFAEFSYQLLQAYDFLYLYDHFNCRIQIGGSDQWGNITAGTELIRRLRGQPAFGVTFPIICDSSGKKFGKSEGNSIYLDERRTSCYDFYQFFLRTEDADIIRFLKIFTFLSLDEIAALEDLTRTAPEKRLAQKRLAEEMTRTIHGERGLAKARQASDVLFGGSLEGLGADDLMAILAQVPSASIPRAQAIGMAVVDMAVAATLSSSKGEARRLIANGGLYINNIKVSDAAAVISEGQLIENRILVLRSGKKNFYLVRVT